ncbi:MAG: hypothetical protein R3B06_00320 [Kofleriaceae bacterium]
MRTYLPDHDLMALAGVPAVYHCHHFNLFLDQTIDDALGAEAGGAVRFAAAREAAHDLARAVVTSTNAVTTSERITAVQGVLSAMGHGRLQIAASGDSGSATGSFLHYGHTWMEKYGKLVRRRHPADAFAAGFAAGAVEVAFDLPRESMTATETECLALRHGHCSFTLAGGAPGASRPRMTEDTARAHVQPTFTGEHEDKVAAIAAGLRDFTAGVAGDARGLVQAFGVYVTAHLATYYNRISYDAVARVEADAPASVELVEDLLRESGHVCVFNTFGGILLSPEWEAMVGPLTGDPTEIIVGCLAIARALGFGHWTLAEYRRGERLVVRTPSSYESAYYLARHGKAKRPNEYFLQGAVLAIAQLAHRVDWKARPQLTQSYYQQLFRGGQLPWKVTEPRSLATGDSLSEVIADRIA